jgi:hypothetical protein
MYVNETSKCPPHCRFSWLRGVVTSVLVFKHYLKTVDIRIKKRGQSGYDKNKKKGNIRIKY